MDDLRDYERCRLPTLRPCRSSRVVIFVEDVWGSETRSGADLGCLVGLITLLR
jgi:hypothetical protein